MILGILDEITNRFRIRQMDSTTNIFKSEYYGGTLVIFNGVMFGCSITFVAIDGFDPLFAFVMVSSVYHLILGVISVMGGYDLKKYHRCLAMAIVGCVLFALPAIILSLIACSIESCDTDFCRNIPNRYLPILAISVFTAFNDIVSSLNYRNLCNGYLYNGFSNSGVTLNPLVYSQHLPVYSTQPNIQFNQYIRRTMQLSRIKI